MAFIDWKPNKAAEGCGKVADHEAFASAVTLSSGGVCEIFRDATVDERLTEQWHFRPIYAVKVQVCATPRSHTQLPQATFQPRSRKTSQIS